MIRILIGILFLASAIFLVAHFRSNQHHGNLLDELDWGKTGGGQCFYSSHLHNSPPTPPVPLRFWDWEQIAGGASGTASVTPEGLVFNVLQVDGANDHLQLYTVGVTLKAGHKYRVAFSAKADKPRKIAIQDEKNGLAGEYTPMDLYAEFSIYNTWSEHEITFTPKQVDGSPDRFPMFLFGQQTGTVVLKNITIDETD